MTSPFANPPSIPAAQTQVIGGGIQDYLPLILQALQASQARKQRKAEQAIQSFPEGAKYGDLTLEQQKAYQRATGIKNSPADMVVRPLPANDPSEVVRRGLAGLPPGVIDPDSALGISLRIGPIVQGSTGAAHGMTTPAGLAAEMQAGEATSQAGLSVAEARRTQAQDYNRATQKIANLPQGQNIEVGGKPGQLSQGELIGLKTFADIVPSKVIADQLEGSTKAEVMKSALRIVADPESTSLAKLFPGVKVSDLIGGIALGMSQMMESSMSKTDTIQAAFAREEAQALFGAAKTISEATGGKYSPTFIAAVMQGDTKAANSPAGKALSRFMDAGFMAGITELTNKGDPSALQMTRLMELARVPGIASNEGLLGAYSNLFHKSLAAMFTRRDMGYDITDVEPNSEAAKNWLDRQATIEEQTGGLFKTGAGGFLWMGERIKGITAPGDNQRRGATQGREGSDATSAARSRQQQDALILEQTMRAIIGDTLTGGTMPGMPGPPKPR